MTTNIEIITETSEEYKARGRVASKNYRELNKTEIEQKRKVKHNCICGSIHRMGDKSKHIKSQKNLDFMQILQ